MKNFIKKSNRIVIVNLIVVFFILVGFVGFVHAVTWQDPTSVAPNLGSLSPTLNTTLLDQEKTGGFYVGTIDGSLRVGSGVAGSEKMYVLGNSYFVGDNILIGNADISADANTASVYAGGLIADNLSVKEELLLVDDVTNKIVVNSAESLGLLTVKSDSNPAITAVSNFSAGNTIYIVNQNAVSGGGIFGSGKNYGIQATVGSAGIAVVGDATGLSGATGGGLYAKGGDNAYGLVGRGLYGIVGLDNTEDVNNPTFVGSGNSVAGLFEGSVDIIPSAGGKSDFIVDGDTLAVRAQVNSVGIGMSNPAVRMHVVGENNLSSMVGVAGSNSTIAEYDDQTHTVSGIYGQSGTVSYSGVGTAWNFGVYGRANDPTNGRAVGIMGVEYGSGDTFAGWFDGEMVVDGKLSVTDKLRTYNAAGVLTANSRIVGNGDLNLAGTNSDISLTGTDSGIFLTGSVNTDGDVEYVGKLNMNGGLPVYGTEDTTCNVAPSVYNEGTMYTCNWCPVPGGQRYFAIMVRMNKTWVNIGYGKSLTPACTGEPYDPETPQNPQQVCPDCPTV